MIISSTPYAVYTILSINDLSKTVWISRVFWIIYQDVVLIVPISQNPMLTFFDVANHYFTLVKAFLYLSVWHFSLKAETQQVDGSPNKQVTIYITFIWLEPFVKSGWIKFVSSACKSHWGGRYETSCSADGVVRSAELLFCPSWITLLEHRICSGDG